MDKYIWKITIKTCYEIIINILLMNMGCKRVNLSPQHDMLLGSSLYRGVGGTRFQLFNQEVKTLLYINLSK